MAALVLFAWSPARAQSAQSTDAPPTITAPQLEIDSPAAYPEQATADRVTDAVIVVLIVEVDATGHVRSAAVEAPQGHGFDEAALAAAGKLVFEPATRGGVAVAARLKYRYVFHPPPPPADRGTAPPADRGTAPATDPLPRDEAVAARATHGADTATREPEVVVVRGEPPPRETTRRTLTKEEIAHIPGTNGDALRSLQSLPGVARPPPFDGQLVVRGSAPADTIIFVDGVDVPLVYHFGGLSSVMPTELLDKIDFYPANYSTIYGRGMGGMVDVGLRNPKGDKLHGMAQVDFIDARVLAEGPVFDSGWTFLVAGRRSYFDLWLGPALSGAERSVTTAPRYYDYQAILEKDLDPHSSFRLAFFGSDDALELLNQSPSTRDPTFAGNIGAHTSFWRAHARYENRFTASTALRATAAVGQDSVDLGVGPNFFNLSQTEFTGRVEIGHKMARGVKANVGADVIHAPYAISLRLPPPRRPGVASGGPLDAPLETRLAGSRTMPAFYTEWELTPWAGTRLVPGVRADYGNATRSWDVAPRVHVRQDLVDSFPRSTLKGGAGLFFQPPTRTETDPVFGQPGLKSNRTVHYDLGFAQEITRRINVSADLFYKALDRLVVTGAGNSGEGFAFGLELLLKYNADERFFGWLAYTLSRSERRDTPSDPLRLFQYDQTHILTALGSYKLGRGWQLGARFRFVSGGLYTPSRDGAVDATAGANEAALDSPPYGARVPPFHQLDIRADKTWTFEDWKLTFYADVQNVYDYQSPEGISYNYNYTQSAYVRGLPILPSLGLRGEF
jgi:TonB family protein